jgi:hypothetical protein
MATLVNANSVLHNYLAALYIRIKESKLKELVAIQFFTERKYSISLWAEKKGHKLSCS